MVEEIPAHVREHEVYCEGANRHERRFHLVHVAQKLASPLYGSLITFAAAKALLKEQCRVGDLLGRRLLVGERYE